MPWTGGEECKNADGHREEGKPEGKGGYDVGTCECGEGCIKCKGKVSI